jgi:hypothetical protein
MTKRRAPATLGSTGATLWRELICKYEFRPDEARVLLDACSEADLIDDLDEHLRGADRIVRGSMNQPVINPLISELRQHRSTLAALLRQLNLRDAADIEPGSMTGSRVRSTAARHAAHVRWRRPDA